MRERIEKHRKARDSSAWITIEETTDLTGAIRRARTGNIVVVDCLTLWVNNLLFDEASGSPITEENLATKCREVLDSCSRLPATVVFVTNEVGMGIIPDNPISRRYRDLAGRCNQVMAERADSVIFMVSGVPLELKKESQI